MLLDGADPLALDRAAQTLADGQLVAFPTETVYGLGARADQDAAVAQIFTAKGRPREHPLIVHVADASAAELFVAGQRLPESAQRLVDAFWPGPLTVIVPRNPATGLAAAGGQDSIGLRCPAHPVAQALLRRAANLGVPGVAAPSANRFGRISPTRAAHVQQELGAVLGDALLVLDGGECEVGIESCIVDCSGARPVLLRPGVLTRGEIEAVLGEPLAAPDDTSPRASGTLASHYAPRAKVRLMSHGVLKSALAMLPQGGLKLAVYSRDAAAAQAVGAWHHPMPIRADVAAHELFSVLRDFDDQGAQLIWVEEPPAGPEWDGVRDRLQRASAA